MLSLLMQGSIWPRLGATEFEEDRLLNVYFSSV